MPVIARTFDFLLFAGICQYLVLLKIGGKQHALLFVMRNETACFFGYRNETMGSLEQDLTILFTGESSGKCHERRDCVWEE